MHFGFSYVGLIFLLMLIVLNIIWTRYQPIDFNINIWSGWSWWLIMAFVCQSGSGAEKTFAKLAKTLGIDKIEKTAVFIDPKSKPNKEKDAEIMSHFLS